MQNKRLFSVIDVSHPTQMLRFFTFFSIISIISILFLVAGGTYFIYYQHIIRGAEDDAMRVSYAIFDQEKSLILHDNLEATPDIFVKEKDFPVLDERMKSYLHPLNMFKIKFFSKDTKIVYSTDHSIIGKKDENNESLARALKGRVDSKIVKKGSIMDLVGETRNEVDVVETYLPIIDKEHNIVGSFEVYLDVSHSYSEIKKVVASSVSVLSMVLIIVFSFLYMLMARLTKQLSVAQNDLQVIAITDGLTQLYNRRYLISRVEEEFVKVIRKKNKGVAFIMIDIDNFKKINDTYGHFAGDEVLIEVAKRIKNSLRKYDLAGRYGGEEFLIVLPESDLEDARVVAERLWESIRGSDINSQKITISLGISSSRGEEDIITAINRADEGLYKAKNTGKDRIAWV